MSTALTQAQQQVLDFVRAYRREHQMPPTRKEITKHFGWKSENAAEEHLQRIASKGHIRLGTGRSRAIFDLEAA